jgi:alpha-N-arabinofuranosidase
MDGLWQMGAKTPSEYGRVAVETAKMMKWVDPGIELAACGSSGRNMPTFGTWEEVVLEHCFDHVEYVSLHAYLNNYEGDTPAFLASPDLVDGFIDEVVAIADAVAARRGSSKRIMLSFDEWNIWYRTRRRPEDRVRPGWPVAPPILEEVYTLEDALAFGGICLALLNHADRVKAACLAQLVNVIAPIMTATGGPAWRQTIFFPMAHAARYARGIALHTVADSPTYVAEPYGEVPVLDQVATWDPETGCLTLFAVNRSLDEPLTLTAGLSELGSLECAEHLVLGGASDVRASNTRQEPDRVRPRQAGSTKVSDGTLTTVLEPLTWNVIRLVPTRRAPVTQTTGGGDPS